MGPPDFAVCTLARLAEDGHDICAVYTQPDKPKGRGYTMQPPPVKEEAQRRGIPVFQPLKMKDPAVIDRLRRQNPELIVVVAYGRLLPKEVLELPRFGCVNVHASLLPRYRGAAPIQWAVLNGEEETGVTTMQMAEGLDTGDILLQSKTKIGADETAGELYGRLAEMGAALCAQTVARLQAGEEILPQKQDDSLSNYAPMLTKELSPVDWSRSAEQIHNQVRGLSPWPSASTTLGGKRLKIHAARPVPGDGTPGEVLCENPLRIACGGHGALELLVVQYEGGKRMKTEDFLRGHRIEKGTILGE